MPMGPIQNYLHPQSMRNNGILGYFWWSWAIILHTLGVQVGLQARIPGSQRLPQEWQQEPIDPETYVCEKSDLGWMPFGMFCCGVLGGADPAWFQTATRIQVPSWCA